MVACGEKGLAGFFSSVFAKLFCLTLLHLLADANLSPLTLPGVLFNDGGLWLGGGGLSGLAGEDEGLPVFSETVTGSLNLEELVWLFVELVDALGSTISLATLGRLEYFSAIFVDLLVLAGIEKVFSSSMVMAISQKYVVVFLLLLMILTDEFKPL